MQVIAHSTKLCLIAFNHYAIPIMKTSLVALVTTLAFASSSQAWITLTTLADPPAIFTVEPAATTAPYSQTASGIVFSGAYALGDTLAGYVQPNADYSAYGSAPWQFGVVMTLTGANPNLPFSVTFFDDEFNSINTYSGTTTAAVAGVATFVPLTLSIPGTGVLTTIGGLQYNWDGGGTINTTVSEIAAVPEPSTYALLAMSGLALGGYAVRRRRRA